VEERDGGQPLEKSKTFTMDLISIRNGAAVQVSILLILSNFKDLDYNKRKKIC
jgi:hypothetical protein